MKSIQLIIVFLILYCVQAQKTISPNVNAIENVKWEVPTCPSVEYDGGLKCGVLNENVHDNFMNMADSLKGDQYLVGTSKKVFSRYPDGKYIVADANGLALYYDLTTIDGLSDLYARVISITDPITLTKTVYVLLDLNFGGSLPIRETIVRMIQNQIDSNFNTSNLFLTGTHNHASPNGCSHNLGYEASTGGFSPEIIYNISYYTFLAIKEAMSNERTMSIYYNTHTIDEESPLIFARNGSWKTYNVNPEVMKNGDAIDLSTTHLAGDRKMELITFVRDNKINSIINFIGVHTNWGGYQAKHLNEFGKEKESSVMFDETRGMASRILEQQIEGVVLYSQRGAGDLDRLANTGDAYRDRVSKELYTAHPERLKYAFNRYTTKYFDYHDINNPEHVKSFIDQGFPGSEPIYERLAKLLTYETVQALSKVPNFALSGGMDNELVYVYMPGEQLPTDRGNYSETLSPRDYYTEDFPKIPLIDLPGQLVDRTIDLAMPFWPKDWRPGNMFRTIVDNTVGRFIQLLFPRTKIAYGAQPVLGATFALSKVDTKNAGIRMFLTAITGVADVLEELEYTRAFLVGDKSMTRHIVAQGHQKDMLLWGGEKDYKRFFSIPAETPRLLPYLYRLGKVLDANVGQQIDFARKGFYDIETLYTTKVPIQIGILGNLGIIAASGEVGHHQARRIEATVADVMKGRAHKFILNDYSNENTGYWFTPEQYKIQDDFLAASADYSMVMVSASGVVPQVGATLFGKWAGPILRYNFEKLSDAMMYPSNSPERNVRLAKFSKPHDFSVTQSELVDKISANKRKEDIYYGAFLNTTSEDGWEITKDVTKMLTLEVAETTVGVVEEASKTLVKSVAEGIKNLFTKILNPLAWFKK